MRKTLMMIGCKAVAELPDVDEVGVSHKLGRTVFYLPRGFALPSHTGKLRAEAVPEGILIRFDSPSGARA